MPTGALTSYLDVAQVVLYGFWVFFFLLVFAYLRREDKREGYPLESDRPGVKEVYTFPPVPEPKAFHLSDGRVVVAPRDNGDHRVPNATPFSSAQGSALVPSGDPMTAGVGPGSWAEREDIVDITMEGHPRIVPLRIVPEMHLETRDPDPRGMAVIGADGRAAGTVTDVWVDRAEMLLRYLEVELAVTDDHRRVLLPINVARVHRKLRQVDVFAIAAHQFADVPVTKNAEQVTLLEEDRIMGYYGGGYRYASPARAESIL